MSHKKYGVHLGLSGPFDLVWLQYSSAARKTHSSSARAYSPSTRTANSTFGLKRPTLHPRYTIYYYYWAVKFHALAVFERHAERHKDFINILLYVKVKPLRKAVGKAIARAIEELIFFRWETPDYLLSDNRKEFDNKVVKEMLNC